MEKVNANKNVVKEEFARFHMPDGRWRMFVKPYTVELKKELEDYRKSKHAANAVSVSEKDGTYCITSKDIMHDFRDLRASLWFMIFWKFRCEARNSFATAIEGGNVRRLRWCENKVDMEFNEENMGYSFYVVTLSPQFIEATSLPRFGIPA